MSEHGEYCYCSKCEAKLAQIASDQKLFDESLMIPGWPECGNSSTSVESIYQAFKRRLVRELCAREQITHDGSYEIPLSEIEELRGELREDRSE